MFLSHTPDFCLLKFCVHERFVVDRSCLLDSSESRLVASFIPRRKRSASVTKYYCVFDFVCFEGLVVSGRIGTGLLLARLDDRWSAPCAIGTVGMGYGMLAGCDINHYLVVLTTHQAVEALLHGTVQLGTEVGIAVGPVGASLLFGVSELMVVGRCLLQASSCFTNDLVPFALVRQMAHLQVG